jgi:16S rRNA processing protein RimM
VAAQKPTYVTLARVLRPHGKRGEVAAEILTDFPERLKSLATVALSDGRSEPRATTVRGCWLSQSRGGQAIFHFQGSNSIDDAEKLVGLEVQIPLADRMALPEGSYYVTDLVGCEVFDKTTNSVIGSVSDVQFTGEAITGTPILVIDSRPGELLVPLAQDICVHMDVGAKRIEVILPEGLRELNNE